MKSCPACKKPYEEQLAECPFCGVIFSKWEERLKDPVEALPILTTTASSKRNFRNVVIVILVVMAFLFYRLNKVVETKTKGMKEEDAPTIANRLALKAAGMDNQFEFDKFVMSGDADAVEKYLSAGYSVNALVRGETLIFWAIEHDNKDLLNVLIKHGVDVNLKNANGQSPLDAILRHVAQRKNGSTPADYRKNAPGIALSLIKAGAIIENPAIKDDPKYEEVFSKLQPQP